MGLKMVTPNFAEVPNVNIFFKIKVYVSFNLEHFYAFFEADPGRKFKSEFLISVLNSKSI